MELDTDKIDDAALALLILTLHYSNHVRKGIDWEITDRLYEKGLIHNPDRQSQISDVDRRGACPRQGKAERSVRKTG